MLTWPFRNHPLRPQQGPVLLRASLPAWAVATAAGAIPTAIFGALILKPLRPLRMIEGGLIFGLYGAVIIAIPALIGTHLMHLILHRLGAVNHALTMLTGFVVGWLLGLADSLSMAQFAGISGALAALAASLWLHRQLTDPPPTRTDSHAFRPDRRTGNDRRHGAELRRERDLPA
jgi:hypothetical protein